LNADDLFVVWIVIRLLFNGHAPPHFHARCGELEAAIDYGVSDRDLECRDIYSLPWKNLTGILSPLVDVDFFNRVFIDQGAVT